MLVYVLDDDPAMCRTLRRVLAADGHDAACFHAPDTLLDGVERQAPDVLLLDIRLPGTSGLDLLATLTASHPAVPVIIVSGTANVDHAIAAFRGGAVQFLRKPFHHADLLAAIADAHRVGLERGAHAARDRIANTIHLTRREHEVLESMADGLQSKNIAHKLALSVRTVEMHRGNIFAKLSVRNAAQAVGMARQLNLV